MVKNSCGDGSKRTGKKLSKRLELVIPLLNRVVASIGQVVEAKQEKEVRKFFKMQSFTRY